MVRNRGRQLPVGPTAMRGTPTQSHARVRPQLLTRRNDQSSAHRCLKPASVSAGRL